VSGAIPVIDAGSGGALALYHHARDEAASLVATALGAHPLLAAAARPGDLVSRRWLARQGSPYLPEIDAVARGIGRPGVYLLNAIYEWACSTSAGPDPAGEGNRMIRILDWGLPGIGRYVVVGRHESPAGPWFNVTWPGYAGVLTAMAPGRFSAAINQAPRRAATGHRLTDEVASRIRMLRGRNGSPAAHLLRRVFETAPDYAAALAMLADEATALAVPAIFTLSGVASDEAAIVEALERRRRIRTAGKAADRIVATANDWQGADWPGDGRRYVGRCCPALDPVEDNRRRRQGVHALQRRAFAGHADLRAPVLNGHSVLIAVMNARRGILRVEALDRAHGAAPGVVRGPLDLAA
jgi:hypothetical protein